MTRDVLPEPGDRYFRYVFKLPPDNPISAKLIVSVDHSYTLYLNGNQISQGNDWRKVDKLEVTDLLQLGENVIAIKGTNEGKIANPAGIILAIRVQYQNGEEVVIKSDQHWVSTADEPSPNWTATDFDAENWVNVRNFGSRHWDRLVDLNFEDNGHQFARASLVRQHPFMKALGRPSRENVSTSRDDQATLLQALELTNGEYFNNVLAEGASEMVAELWE